MLIPTNSNPSIIQECDDIYEKDLDLGSKRRWKLGGSRRERDRKNEESL